MTLRSFMALLLVGGVLATTLNQEESSLDKKAIKARIKIEEYNFEPMYINVPSPLNDAGLD